MARDYVMHWDERHRRWHKMYRKVRYCVSCRQLGVPPTKQGSYRAANAWWAAKQAEIDGFLPEPSLVDLFDPAKRTPELRERLVAWAKREGDELMLAAFEGRLRTDEIGMVVGHDPPTVPATPRAAAAQVGAYLDSQRLRVGAGQVSSGEIRNREHALRIFGEFLAADRKFVEAGGTVDAIDAAAWQRYYDHLLRRVGLGEFSTSYAAKALKYSRWFLAHLAGLGGFKAPENLATLKLTITRRPVEVFTPEEVRRLYASAAGQLQLHILLALNCGFTAQDISDLPHGEVDWEGGVITRKRGKTERYANVPTVSYSLWPETQTLLARHRSSHPDHVLRTRSGGPWVDRVNKNSDQVRANWRHLIDRTGIKKPFKLMRKTASDWIENFADARTAELFLGHAPETIREKSYTRPPHVRLAAALPELRKALFPEWGC